MSTGVTVTGGAERFVSTIGESRPTIGLDVHGRSSQTSEECGRAGCRQEPTRSGTFAEVKVTAYAHRRAGAGAVGRYPYVGSRGLRPGCQTRRSLGRSGPCAAATSRTLSGLGCPERTDLDLLPGLLHLFVGHRVADLAFDAVDRQQVLRHGGPPSDWAGTSRLSPLLRTGLAQIDT